MTPPNVPLYYRLWHLYLEPFAALGGVYQLHFMPRAYFEFMPATAQCSPKSQIVYSRLASTYLLFAFIEGVLMQVVDDVRLWKYIVLGLALCDSGHIYAAWQEMGTELILSPWLWRGKDVVTNVLNVLPLVTRVAFLLGIGCSSQGTGTKGS